MATTNLSALSLATLQVGTFVKDATGVVHMLVTLTTIPLADVEQLITPLDSRDSEDLLKKCFGIETDSGLPCLRLAIIDPGI